MSNKVIIKEIGPCNDIMFIAIRGALDSVIAYNLQEQFDTLIQNGYRKYLLDLTDLEHISSAGVGLFSAAILDLKRHQGDIVFINIPEQVYHTLRITRLIDIFTQAETLEKAIELLDTN